MNTDTLDLAARASAAAAVLRAEGATEVYVFGSVADGRASGHSDLDMAVLGLPDERFYGAAAKASSAAGVLIDLVSLEDDTPFIRVLREHGNLRRVA